MTFSFTLLGDYQPIGSGYKPIGTGYKPFGALRDPIGAGHQPIGTNITGNTLKSATMAFSGSMKGYQPIK